MKIRIKWFLTGNVSEIEETESILNPETTILEVKGLIQLKFGFLPKETVLISGHLLSNEATLRSVGVTGGSNDVILTAHVIREGLLESSNLDQDDTTHDDDLQEFTHEDFIMAMKMLGKDVPVSSERLHEVRNNAPRQRPAFLNQPRSSKAAGSSVPQPPPGMPGVDGPVSAYNPKQTKIHKIFENMMYGMRREGLDKELALHYPGVEEPFQFWDMRLPEVFHMQEDVCAVSEVCLEIFYFGEFTVIKNTENFLTLMRHSLESNCGVKVRTPLPMREAGCMYPLVACPVIMNEMDAMELGNRIFEDFGKPQQNVPKHGLKGDPKAAGNVNGGGCAQQ